MVRAERMPLVIWLSPYLTNEKTGAKNLIDLVCVIKQVVHV